MPDSLEDRDDQVDSKGVSHCVRKMHPRDYVALKHAGLEFRVHVQSVEGKDVKLLFVSPRAVEITMNGKPRRQDVGHGRSRSRRAS